MTSLFRSLLVVLALLAPAVSSAEAVYPAVARAEPDLAAAVEQAAREKKRVLLDFGGNWCPDCKVLDIHLRAPENQALLAKRYVVVHVNVGEKGITDNFALAERYGVPLKKGVPALVVLDASGKVLHAQKNGEFESMRKMDPGSVNEFLARWSGP